MRHFQLDRVLPSAAHQTGHKTRSQLDHITLDQELFSARNPERI